MNKLKYLFFIGLASAVVFITGCSEDPEPVNPNPTTYSDAASVFNVSCAFSSCHESGAAVGSLANYDDAVAFVGFGRIMGAINHDADFSPMPKNGAKMSQVNIDKVQSWIDDGLLE